MAANDRGQSEYFRGTIHSYNQTSGSGFIELDENQGTNKLLLVHSKCLRRPSQSLEPGDRVLFMTRQVANGLVATDVHSEVVEDESDATADELIDGVVKDYNTVRGFGFIQLQDKRDAFFHISYV
ncbi:MAG: cold shock domain-containing protein, partial [Bryobacteraceae bacterium]